MKNELYQLLREIVVLLAAGDQETLAPFELDPLEYTALLFLEQDSGWRMVDLCERLICDKSKMTRIIDHLEQRGVAERRHDPQDRRAWQVYLTESGATFRGQVQATHLASLQVRFDVLNEVEKEQLLVLLKRLRINLG